MPTADPIAPRFFNGLDIRSALAYDDTLQVRRGIFRLVATVLRIPLMNRRHRRQTPPRKDILFLPFHQTKFEQMRPFWERVRGRLFFALVPWPVKRCRDFNRWVREQREPNITFHPYFPTSLWKDIWGNRAYWKQIRKERGFRFLLRRLSAYIDLYGVIGAFDRILSLSGARFLLSSSEEIFYSSVLSQLCRKKDVADINFMHGNCYPNDQLYSVSFLFGPHQRDYLEQKTRSQTRFEIIGSSQIKRGNGNPNYELARRVLFLNQGRFPDAPWVPAALAQMLASFLDAAPGVEMHVKLHPQSTDPVMARFFRERGLNIADESSCQRLFPSYGLCMTCSSTTGLESIAAGVPTIFLNPGGRLEAGPLAFMKPFAVASAQELAERVRQLTEDRDAYQTYFEQEVNHLSGFYHLNPVDYDALAGRLGLV